MGEPQLFESTVIAGTPTLLNGAEVQNSDVALVGQVAGLADDRVLAELLRIPPFVSSVSKAIIPYDISQTYARFTPGTVQPTGSANGSVSVLPFRAVIGARTSIATNAISSWRDIRSGIFIPPGNASLNYTLPIGANSSGNPRWDLIYATLTVDAPTNQVQRRVKNPSTSNQSVQSIYQYLAQPVVVSVQAGTPGSSPTVPTIPADSGTSYNVPLAAVRVINGFGPTSTLLTGDIRDLCPVVPLARATGAMTVRPSNGNNDGAGTYATNLGWSTSSGVRAPLFLPPTMVGGEQVLVQIDYTNPAAPSHPNNSIIDSSVDWTNRFFIIYLQGDVASGSGTQFATAPGTGFASSGIPSALNSVTAANFWHDIAFQNSTFQNVSGSGVQKNLYLATSSNSNSVLTGSMTLGVMIDYDSGQLRCVSSNSPVAKLWMWIVASAQYPNF